MKIRHLLAAILLSVGALTFSSHASADTVLYDGSGFVVGTQSFVKSFDLATPGMLTVTLTNVAWPQELANLNLVLTSSSGAMGPEMGAGTSSFAVKAGGDVFAQWFGTAQGALDAGVFSLKVDFQPLGITVPLPASIALLLSGLALLMWQRRGQREPQAGLNRTAGRESNNCPL